MQLRAFLTLAAVAATVLAGCSAKPSAAEQNATDAALDGLELEASSTTGVIRGVVVDEAVRPLADATVVVNAQPERTAVTDATGVFGFEGLEPGTYFLRVSKAGYFAVQQSAEVQAGVADPPAVKVLLQQDVGYLAFVSAQVYEGFIECTSSLIVVCGLPNLLLEQNVTNDRSTPTLYFAPNASLIQTEMVWASTQPVSPDLYYEQEALDGCDADETFINSTEGPSPIMTQVSADDVQDFGIGDGCGIYYSVFSAGLVGMTVQQRFSFYVHAYYGYLPPADWRFTIDGAAPQPPQ